jgi:hypothetical protein
MITNRRTRKDLGTLAGNHCAAIIRLATMLCGTLGVLLTAPTGAAAQATYLGPTPYLSEADSPFETTAFGFCLEDFENNKFDVPGATGNGSLVSPGGLTDSVDADDGAIDGSGNGGHSYFSGNGTTGIIIDFDAGRTHGLPTEVGVVWTDGGLNAGVTFEAFGPDGVSLLGPNGPNDHADASNYGETAEDRFYGATNATGISKIVISNPGGGIEVDHLQLNRCILCGDSNGDLDVTASDALYSLAVSVGIETCDPCICDVNNSGSINVTDALTILRTAVGSGPTMSCPACEGL